MTEVIREAYSNKLRNKFYGLLCEFEKNGQWEKFLDSIMLELMGIPEEERPINFYILVYNLNTLRYVKYEYFRKIVFDCMSLLGR